jgi:hypothetical protein
MQGRKSEDDRSIGFEFEPQWTNLGITVPPKALHSEGRVCSISRIRGSLQVGDTGFVMAQKIKSRYLISQ